ncbi:MAG: ATP-binding protein [Rhodothermales bacterium]
MRVLIADDDPVVRKILTRVTESHGHTVTACESGEAAWEQYLRDPFPLLVLDWMMDGMSGLDLCRKIRSLPHGDRSVIIAFTGRSRPEDLLAVLEAGFDDYLTKPIDKSLFLIRLTIAERRVAEIAKRKEAEEKLISTNEELQTAYQKLKESHLQLVHSEKMASLGQLAAGMAHEINNPISFIMSNIGILTEYVDVFKQLLEAYAALDTATRTQDVAGQLALRQKIQSTEENGELTYILEDIDTLLSDSFRGTERIRDIVLSLKNFVRLDEDEMQVADINEGIETTLRMVWNELKYKCEILKKLNPVPRILCFPGQLNQVFMNLLINAAQAIPDQGQITIETEVIETEVVIRISDTGVGIPPENLSKLFNPFFTTKPVNQGTGLGLSISYGIIEKHNGRIEVESEVGQGTTFTIYLPIVEEAPDTLQEDMKAAG